jgi:acyl-CoA thioesterase FadM
VSPLLLRLREWETAQHADALTRDFVRDTILGVREFRYVSRVGTHDLDANVHMSNSKYSKEADFSRFDLLRRSGLYYAAYELGTSMVVAEVMVRFRQELRKGQQFAILSRIVGYDERSLYIQHRFVVEKRTDGRRVEAASAAEGPRTHALLFARVMMTSKGTLRPVLERLGITVVETESTLAPPTGRPGTTVEAARAQAAMVRVPLVRPPPDDIAGWVAASRLANRRCVGASHTPSRATEGHLSKL